MEHRHVLFDYLEIFVHHLVDNYYLVVVLYMYNGYSDCHDRNLVEWAHAFDRIYHHHHSVSEIVHYSQLVLDYIDYLNLN